MMLCGLLGKTLAHSYSPQIHAKLHDDPYRLFEIAPEGLADFLQNGDWDALNVTVPYKKAVLPYCSALSDTVKAVGSANTLIRRPDGSIFAENTDVFGFSELLEANRIDVRGKKALVFGSGGASAAVCFVLKKRGAKQITVISRSGENNYENLSRHFDAEIFINATPLGMYPENGTQAAAVRDFKRCTAVIDLIYNPLKTALLLEAEALSIPHANGLLMLAAQAKKSSELFCGKEIADEKIAEITQELEKQMRNIVLIGMPGCGKSTVGALLAKQTGRTFFDSDEALARKFKMPVSDIIGNYGEAAFRDAESAVLKELGKQSGCIIATGGGAVLREENYASLHQNGVVILLTRELALLPKEGRPLSQENDLALLYKKRESRYRRFADRTFANDTTAEALCKVLTEALL